MDEWEWSVMAKIIFFGNYKGGVGKTTSVYSIARYWSQSKRILLLDLDPQSSLSDICIKYYKESAAANIKNDIEDDQCLNYMYDLYINKIEKYPDLELEFDLERLILQIGNLCFIPSNLYYPNHSAATNKLGLDELAIKMNDTVEYMRIRRDIISYIDKNYQVKDANGNVIPGAKFDYIFIDCPPANNIITKGAFLLSDYFVIPTILDGMSTNGVIHYIETVAGTYKQYCCNSDDAIIYRYLFGNKPNLLGIFYTFIRGQADYKDEKTNFANSLDAARKAAAAKGEEYVAELLGTENIIDGACINNCVNIARNIATGSWPDANNDYENLSKKLFERLEGKNEVSL